MTRPAPETAEDYRKIIDTYMPTIITGVDHLSRKAHRKDRETWTDDDLAIMAAYSYAHSMLYRLTGRQNTSDGHPEDYDLPSVLDLHKHLKARHLAIQETLEKFPETRELLGRFEGSMYAGLPWGEEE